MAVSVTIPGAPGTVGITTNAQPATASASLAQTISTLLNALPPANVTAVNGTFPPHVNNLVVTTNGLNFTVPGGNSGSTYDYLTIQDGLNETVTATGSGPFVVMAGTGGLNYTGLAGAQTVIAGGGTVGSASNIINLSGSTGAGNFVAVGGGADTVFGGSGNDTVFSGGSGDILVVTGSGTMNFIGGSNNATVIGSGHTTTVIGGVSGSIAYVDTVGGAAEYHAQGGAEVFNATLSGGNNTIYGAFNQSGTETLFGGSGNDYIDALNATASVVGGSGADTLVGARFNASVSGSGNATLTGGAGSDTFLFKNGFAGGHDYVTDLSGGDIVNLAFYGYTSSGIATLLASATVSGGSSTITLSDATQITFIGITTLNPTNFTSS